MCVCEKKNDFCRNQENRHSKKNYNIVFYATKKQCPHDADVRMIKNVLNRETEKVESPLFLLLLPTIHIPIPIPTYYSPPRCKGIIES